MFLVLKLISFLCIFLEYCSYRLFKLTKYSILVLLMIATQTVTLISTFLNNGSITRFLGPAIASVSMLMLGDLIFDCNWRKILKYIEKYLSVFFVINMITYGMRLIGIPLYPSFLGIDNRWIYFLLPWTLIAFINDYIENGKLKHSIYIYFFSLTSLILVWSAGAIVAFLALPISYFLIRLLLNKYSIIKSCISRLTFFVFLILNYVLVNNIILEIFKPFIRGVLKKDITLSGRTYLWDGVIELLHQKPILGIGMQSHEYDLNFFYKAGLYLPGTKVNHPHNHMLYISYHGGLLSLILFLILIYIVLKKIDRIKNKQVVCIYLAGVISIFVAALVDTLDFSLFYLFIPIIMRLPLDDIRMKLNKYLSKGRK